MAKNLNEEFGYEVVGYSIWFERDQCYRPTQLEFLNAQWVSALIEFFKLICDRMGRGYKLRMNYADDCGNAGTTYTAIEYSRDGNFSFNWTPAGNQVFEKNNQDIQGDSRQRLHLKSTATEEENLMLFLGKLSYFMYSDTTILEIAIDNSLGWTTTIALRKGYGGALVVHSISNE